MFIIILKSHNGTVHRIWQSKAGFTKEQIDEIENIAELFMQDVVYMEAANNEDISAEEIQLEITKLNSPKESTPTLQ